jgi:DNA-binding response OmpR family regulator
VSSVLLVEDDERVRRFIVSGLKSEGHAVSTAGDGSRGLAAARIEALIRRASGVAIECMQPKQVGDVALDRESCTVRRARQLVDLTAKEFQLLDLLMSSPGKVLSRTRILSKVWNCDNDPLTNVVDVYMSRLRTKLHWDPEDGPLRTLRGYGYQLDVRHS